MTDVHSNETLEKAREMLCEIALLADDQSLNMTHSDYVMKIWDVFNKGRKYEQFVTEADTEDKAVKDKEIETALLNLFCGVWQLQESIDKFYKGIKGKAFDDIVTEIRGA